MGLNRQPGGCWGGNLEEASQPSWGLIGGGSMVGEGGGTLNSNDDSNGRTDRTQLTQAKYKQQKWHKPSTTTNLRNQPNQPTNRCSILPGGTGLILNISAQIITTFPAGWSPQMVVIVRECTQNPLNSGLGIIVICPDISAPLHSENPKSTTEQFHVRKWGGFLPSHGPPSWHQRKHWLGYYPPLKING